MMLRPGSRAARWPNRHSLQFDRLLLALYLVTGWTILGMGGAFADNLSKVALFLLLCGGLDYSCGAYVHVQGRMRFLNVT